MTWDIFFPFFRCKVKVKIGTQVDLGAWRRSHLLLLGGGGGGRVVRCQGVIKEKSPDFRSLEVGISGVGKYY